MDVKGAAVAVLISVLWGANTVVIKMGLEEAPPLRLACMRFVVGGAVICLWAWATGRFAGFRIEPAEWRPAGILGPPVQRADGCDERRDLAHQRGACLGPPQPLRRPYRGARAHFLIPGDRLTVRKLAGVLIAYSGIVLLGARQVAHGSPTLLGDVVVTVAGVLLAERTVYLARAVQRLDPVKLLLAQAIVGTALFVVVSSLVEPAPTRWTLRLAGSIAYQGILISGFNFVVNLALLRRYRPSALSAFFLTQPIFGVIAAALVAGDPLTPDLLIACAAVAVGIGLTSR